MAAKNLISMKWLESRDKGKVHKGYVKHLVEDADDLPWTIINPSEIQQQIYRATVVDLLAWKPGVRHKVKGRK